ncbi:MAG TPA: DUF4124 domain-containing protein [Gammaproteobacteria bacterium]|jgi:hypothetical protein
MRARSLLLIVTCLLAGAASIDAGSDQVYRWVDKDGKVHYSSTPPPATPGIQSHKIDVTPQVITMVVPVPQLSPQQRAVDDRQKTRDKAQADHAGQADPAQCAELQSQLVQVGQDASLTDAARARKQRMLLGQIQNACP